MSLADNDGFFVSDGRCEHDTAPSTFLHTRTFCPMWLKLHSSDCFLCVFQNSHVHTHRSCFTRSHLCLITHLFHFCTAPLLCSFPRMETSIVIHAVEHSVVDWSNKVLSQVCDNLISQTTRNMVTVQSTWQCRFFCRKVGSRQWTGAEGSSWWTTMKR